MDKAHVYLTGRRARRSLQKRSLYVEAVMFERTFSFWRRLVGKNPSEESDIAQDDRRIWVRYPAEIQANIYLNGKVEPTRLAVEVKDISLGGANLIVEREFAPGSMLSLELPRSTEGDTHEVLACVVRVGEAGPGKWSLGCVFSRELTDHDLEGFGAKRIRHDPEDQRIWMRFPVSLHAKIQKVGAAEGAAFDAKILNLSPSGIGVLVKHLVEAGSLLSVDLVNGEGATVKTILACAVHVTGHPGGEYSLGCNFIRQLQEEELTGLVRA